MLALIPTRQLMIVAILGLCPFARTVFAQQANSAADVFPGSTAIYAEIPDPAALIDTLLTHPVHEFAHEQREFQQFLASPQMAAAMLAKVAVETQIGESITDSLKTNAGGGIYLGLDTETQGLAILFRSKNEAKLKKLAGTIINMIDTESKKGDGQGLTRKDYRNAKAAQINNLMVARYQEWFLITNKPKLAKTIADNLHDGSKSSLANQNWFVQARRHKRANSSNAWAAVDLKTIRMAGVAKELFKGKTNNPGIELVIGGILDVLKNAPIAVAEISLDNHLEISVSTPFKNEWAHGARDFFYGNELSGHAPSPLKPKNMIASLTTHRDLGEWWLSKEDLFEENVIAQLAQADSQFSTIFSGLDFGEHVLGSLEPDLQLVVAENSFDPNHEPDVKLPAFAIVSKLKDVENIQRRFKIAFQSVIGFANINLGQQGQPQLDLETESIGQTRVSSATYMYDSDTASGLLLHNFGPTIAFHEPYFIVASNKHLAIELAQLAKQRKESGNLNETEDTNTRVTIDGTALKNILSENREPLIANNMIQEGNTRAQAERDIGIVLKLAELVESVELNFSVQPDRMQLDFGVEIAGSEK